MSRAVDVAREERDQAKRELEYQTAEAVRLSGLLFEALAKLEQVPHG